MIGAATLGALLFPVLGPLAIPVGGLIGGMLAQTGASALYGEPVDRSEPERVGDLVSTPGGVYKGLAGDGYAMKKDESGKLRVAAMGTKSPHSRMVLIQEMASTYLYISSNIH